MMLTKEGMEFKYKIDMFFRKRDNFVSRMLFWGKGSEETFLNLEDYQNKLQLLKDEVFRIEGPDLRYLKYYFKCYLYNYSKSQAEELTKKEIENDAK